MIRDDFRPLSFWSFNGSMQDEEIQSQIAQFKKQGYGGFFMHARAGMTLEYMGEDWMHACRVAVEEAKKQGLKAWLYDENGWPSGFAGGKVPALGEDFTAKHLYFIRRAPGKSDGKVLAAYRKQENGMYVKMNETDAETADLYCCMGQLKGYADLLNPKAMRAFLDFTHEKYYEELGEYFGNVIPGIFTDEPQLVGKFPYTFTYPERFKKMYGYDFFEEAWMLCEDGLEYAPFKYKASKLVAEMLRIAFTEQIESWCQEHNIQFTGHFSNEDGLCNQTTANYNLMAQYEVMARPGIDFLGRRLTSPVLVKQISDAAYLAGKKRITSESFGCSGWDVTFNDLLWITDWQAAFGINSIVTHLSAYSMQGRRKRDYPAFFSYQEPWWDNFHEVSERIEQVNRFMSQGRRKVELLVVYPISSMWCTVGGHKQYSAESRFVSNQFRLLIENLLDLQKDFLIVTEEELQKFEVIQGKLLKEDIACRTICVADTLSLDKTTYDSLFQLAEQGGNVVFMNRYPQLCEGEPSDRAKEIPSEIVENRRGLLEKYFLATHQESPIIATDGFEGQAAAGIILTTRFLEQEERVLLMNPSRCDTKKVYLKAKGRKEIQNLYSFYDGEYTYAPITLAPTESRCLVLKNQGEIKETFERKTDHVSARKIPVESVSLLEKNALTVDACDVFLNGRLLCEQVLPAACADKVYENAYKEAAESRVELVYSFEADFADSIPDDLTLIAEGDGMASVQINGVEVLPMRNGWWIDKSFDVFPIAEFVKNGKNKVVMSFSIIRPKELEEQGEFEGYRNRFFYAVEPENIYISGNFDVQALGSVTEGIETFHVGGSFRLTDMTEKQAGELTHQNLWFYRGNVKLQSRFEAKGAEQKIHLEEFSGTAADICVNGKYAGCICRAPYELDITEYTVRGENTLEVVVYGSNRNLLGPHHHIKGNPHFVGVPTFMGTKGFTDFIYPDIVEGNTHTDKYSFVKFVGGRIILNEVSI